MFQELRFVRDPFLRPEGWQDKDPSEWVPAHDYGGNRIPIRLEVCAAFLSCPTQSHVHRVHTRRVTRACALMPQVFMHVLSAMASKTTATSKVRFGDYKMAHTLDKNDPLWLHEKEVCVCVCVCVCVIQIFLALSCLIIHKHTRTHTHTHTHTIHTRAHIMTCAHTHISTQAGDTEVWVWVSGCGCVIYLYVSGGCGIV